MAKNNKKDKSALKQCAKCSNKSTLTCTICNKVNYCTKEHQKEDWTNHKNICRPYEIANNSILGRHLIASKDIKPGELILKESPIIIGPSITSSPLCLKCYKPIFPNRKQTFCLKCGVAPLCSLTCTGIGHSNKECELFNTNPKITAENLVTHCQIILPLRCLLLRHHENQIWSEFLKLEAHLVERRNTSIWRNHRMNVEEIINNFGLLTQEDLTEELIQKICGILDVNSFELRVPDSDTLSNFLRGVFLQAALMAHDCIGNTHLAVDDYFNMTVHASVPILKGQPIYFNYTNALQSTFDRQEHLKEGKYFNCTCKRCLDSTECGTYMSSIRCVKCRKGLVSPTKVIKDLHQRETIWKCFESNCTYQCNGSLINSTVNCAKNILEETDKNDIRIVEKLIKKFLQTFAPNHSIILDLKQNLIGLYSEFLRREINPNRKFLNRKLQLCQEILPVLEIIEPGVSRLTGITLYEMHIPMVIIANREYDNKEITAEDLLKKMLQAELALKKSISYLLYEPTASPEGRLGTNALNELKLLRKSISNVQQIIENKKQDVNRRRKKNK